MMLMPLWQGRGLDWSYQHGQELFGSLVGHVVYGLIVGTIYAAVDRLWIALFIESDPINRQPEAPGSRTVRSIGWGALAGLAGGLVFLPIITIVTGLSQLAGLVGGTSPVVGVLVHLFISGLIGISYGLLFEHGVARLCCWHRMGSPLRSSVVVCRQIDAFSYFAGSLFYLDA